MMIKKLSKHGNSLALVIDKPILELLGIDEDTNLEVRAAGRGFYIEPQVADAVRDALFQRALDNTNEKYGEVLRRLAE